MNADDVSALLKENDRPRKLADDERDRVMSVLQRALDDEAVVRSGSRVPDPEQRDNSVVQYIDASVVQPQVMSPAKPRRRVAWLSAAAGVLLIVGALAWQGRQESGKVETVAAAPAATATATVDAAASVEAQKFCRQHLADLIAGIGAWNGVEEWARLTDDREPAPHLPDLVDEALQALGAIVGLGSDQQRDQLVASLDGLSYLGSANREARSAALRESLTYIREVIAADIDSGGVQFAECDLRGLDAATAIAD